MRVHELAKTLDVSSKELMEELHRIKVPVEHHSNSLDDETVRKIMAIYQARRGGGGVVKKITRRAGQPASSPPSPSVFPSSHPPVPSPGAPRLVRRSAPRSPLATPPLPPPRQPGIGGPPIPPPMGPVLGPVAPGPPPPIPMRIQPPSTIAPPTPLNEPNAPPPPPPVAEIQGPKAAPTEETPSGMLMPPKAPSKPREAGKVPKRRGTTIDLDTFKTVVGGQPSSPTEAGAAKRTGRGAGRKRRDGHSRKREPARRVTPPPTQESGRQHIRPSFLIDASVASRRRDARAGHRAEQRSRSPRPKAPKAVTVYGQVSVAEFAEKIGVPAPDVIKRLMLMGEMLSINAMMSDEMAELLAGEFDVQLTIIPETDEYDVREFAIEESDENLVSRPPVVTVMGHVDHGKTSLLDRLRSTSVAEGEAGGITQHIGASSIQTPRGEITFLDTPGHEAFTAMRARGAEVTDLVILIVAANDGVMPQTIEAINHAKAAEVPIIVALNKIDMPGAAIDRVKNQLMAHGLVSEELGGDMICCPISAKTGEGIEHLLEMILLQAEVLELRADPTCHGEGVVVESRVEAGRGVTATVLVQKGTLRVGDAFLSGPEFGKIRAMNSDTGQPIMEVGTGRAAEIFGLRGAPVAGEPFLIVPNERIAREIAERRSSRRRQRDLSPGPKAVVYSEETGLFDFSAALAEESKELKLIVRADVQGSVEAVTQSLMRLVAEGVRLEILHSGVGAITTSDVNLAVTSDCRIIGFGVRPEAQAAQLAEQNGIPIQLHTVIYELIDDIKALMAGLLEPTYNEKQQGRAEIRQVFRISRLGNIAGCYVLDGEIHRSHQIRLVRDGAVVTERRRLASLRRVKDDVAKVTAGMECGMGIDGFNDIREGDVIEAYTLEQVAREIQVTEG
jgi:translation initiation factor IF-2